MQNSRSLKEAFDLVSVKLGLDLEIWAVHPHQKFEGRKSRSDMEEPSLRINRDAENEAYSENYILTTKFASV